MKSAKKIIIALFVTYISMYFCEFAIDLFNSSIFNYSYNYHWFDYIRIHTNIIPFKSIFFYVRSLFDGTINKDIAILNIFKGMVVTIPWGCLLPIVSKKNKKYKRFFINTMTLLVFTEIIQVVLCMGSFDVDDLITGILGATIGFSIVKALSVFVNKRHT